jgi:hypothetical protein
VTWQEGSSDFGLKFSFHSPLREKWEEGGDTKTRVLDVYHTYKTLKIGFGRGSNSRKNARFKIKNPGEWGGAAKTPHSKPFSIKSKSFSGSWVEL